jgi:hypothetical protein
MKIDYDLIKLKLAQVSNECYDLFYSKILLNKNLNIDVIELINKFNTFFNLASIYIEFVINNEISKINDTIAFFQNGFEYLNNLTDYVEDDVKEFLSIILQYLYESFTEYSFLHTGKACAFAHQNDINLHKNLHVKFSRDPNVYNNHKWFDDPNLKSMKNTLIGKFAVSCTILSYHSLYLMFRITEQYLKRIKYRGNVELDYNIIEGIDSKLNEFFKFLKSQANTKYLYFMNDKLSIKVRITCGIYSFENNNNCFIEYQDSKVIIIY